MSKLDSHPAVMAVRSKSGAASQTTRQTVLAVDEFRRICLELGADDVGFVSIDRSELDDQRDDILKFFRYGNISWIATDIDLPTWPWSQLTERFLICLDRR